MKKIKYLLLVIIVLFSFNVNASSKCDKDENLRTLELFEKYYGKGVNGIYFSKDKMDNLSDYMYFFDRLIKNNYSYILNMNSRITNQEREIYLLPGMANRHGLITGASGMIGSYFVYTLMKLNELG